MVIVINPEGCLDINELWMKGKLYGMKIQVKGGEAGSRHGQCTNAIHMEEWIFFSSLQNSHYPKRKPHCTVACKRAKAPFEVKKEQLHPQSSLKWTRINCTRPFAHCGKPFWARFRGGIDSRQGNLTVSTDHRTHSYALIGSIRWARWKLKVADFPLYCWATQIRRRK